MTPEEIERLREVRQRGCDCSDEDACAFARERDEALAEVDRLRLALDASRRSERIETALRLEALEERNALALFVSNMPVNARGLMFDSCGFAAEVTACFKLADRIAHEGAL